MKLPTVHIEIIQFKKYKCTNKLRNKFQTKCYFSTIIYE